MRKYLTIAVIALTAAFGAVSADAQVRMRPVMNPGVAMKGPRVNPVRPKLLILPPSAALKRAMRLVPNSKPLKVVQSGQNYVVSLKSGGTITRVTVNAATGAITSGP